MHHRYWSCFCIIMNWLRFSFGFFFFFFFISTRARTTTVPIVHSTRVPTIVQLWETRVQRTRCTTKVLNLHSNLLIVSFVDSSCNKTLSNARTVLHVSCKDIENVLYSHGGGTYFIFYFYFFIFRWFSQRLRQGETLLGRRETNFNFSKKRAAGSGE